MRDFIFIAAQALRLKVPVKYSLKEVMRLFN
jgi:hypothetical protein